MKKPFKIAIVGGIAVGKSTIIDHLKRNLSSYTLVEEDVSKNIFLSDFYDDMHRWAFHSRISTLAMIAHNYCEAFATNNSDVVLFDRCLDELITFAKMHFDRGNMSDKEFETYLMLYNSVIELAPSIDLFIYINCSAEKSMERIKKRNRSFEQGITIEYLQSLNKYYKDWLSTLDESRVISINTDDTIPVEYIIKLLETALP